MTMPRLHVTTALSPGPRLLDETAARHAQVLRLQPGDALTLFDGRGGQWQAEVRRMGRASVEVEVLAHEPLERELPQSVHLALGVPANERMDWLVEKATELGAASVQPLLCARGVLRLEGERAQRRQAHWQAIAAGACAQCGRNRVPAIGALAPLAGWLEAGAAPAGADEPGAGKPGPMQRAVLSLSPAARPLAGLLLDPASGSTGLLLLSGPEGGLAPEEEARAMERGFVPVSLGPRVLRAETAPLAVLAAVGLLGGDSA